MGLGLIIAGACFLFDPYIGVFDILPDSLGYLFISLGLARIADLDDRLGDALRSCRRLALVALARIIAVVLAYGLVSPAEQPVFILLALFSLGVLDVLLFVPFFRQLSGGLIYLGSRTAATAIFDRQSRRSRPHMRTLTERYTTFSILAFLIREAAAILPEATVLTHERGGVMFGEGSVLYEFVGLFRLVGIAVSLVVGIIWLGFTVRFVRRLLGDTDFLDSIGEKYRSEVLPRADLFATRAVRAALVSFSAAALLGLDFFAEGVNLIPDTLAAALLCLSVLFLRRYIGRGLPALLASVAWGLAATLTWVLQLRYFSILDLPDIHRSEELYVRWQLLMIAELMTAALFALALALTLRAIWRLAKAYTGVRALSERETYAAERSGAIHRRLRRKLLTVAVLGGLTAVSTLVWWGVTPQMPDIVTAVKPGPGEVLGIMLYETLRDAYWFFDGLIGILYFAFSVHLASEISEQMEYSYLMNGESRA